jgi:hypothetical protein
MKSTNVFLGFVLIGLLVVSAAGNQLKAAIPASERAALIALYNSTIGDNWDDNSGWKGNKDESDGFSQIGSEGTWYGITVSDDHVIVIDLHDNQLSGSIPPKLVNLSNLEVLSLGENRLSGSILAELGNLGELKELYLHDNQLSGSIPQELGNLSNLEKLGLSTNQLSGSIPPGLGNLSNLDGIDLGSNQLSGSIPTELGNLGNLRNLFLYGNQLSGSIPPELGNLSNLEFIIFSNNRLSGNIPPELGNLSNLYGLCLNYNQLSGSIPLELGNLKKLVFLMLSSNQLTGNIPSSLTNLTQLYPDEEFTDICYNALYTNDETVRTFLNSIDPGWEYTQTIAPANVGAVGTFTTSIRVSWAPITFSSWTGGGYKVYYSTTSGGPYTYSGITVDKSASSYDVTGLNPWTTYYLVVKTQTDPHYGNHNTVLSEYSEEVSAATNNPPPDMVPPFGFFDTPGDGSTVCGGIPVTGWALDETGIYNVKIYRAQGDNLVYIGDAVFVEGARPDVAAAYPGYPYNTKAGWGYMMLTNFLPNNGSGTFVIHAIATDFAGKTTTLGTKTIHCDNANAVKPFGAIDTPTQGGSASGGSFINWGWVLTPQPNHIPTDGSTINVYVDGVDVGHPTYNIYRSDIANLFPGYANSNGAAGYFYLDTTAYENGVHTIQWTARDSGGNSDGIGCKYFSIRNTGTSASSSKSYQVKTRPQTPILNISKLTDIPVDYSVPVRFKIGFKEDSEPQVVFADERGINRIDIKEVERVQIHLTDRFDENATAESLSSNSFAGYLEVNNRLEPLPVGSTLDTHRGIFYWQPGPGFIGEYRFVFIEKEQNTGINRKNIIVKIVPRYE